MSDLNLNLNTGDNDRDNDRDRDNRGHHREVPRTSRDEVQQNVYNPFAHLSSGRVFGQVINPGSGSEAFNTLVKTMQKEAEGVKSLDIIAFPRESFNNLTFSVIAVVRNNRVLLGPGAPKHNFVMAQLLIVECTGETPHPYTDSSDTRRPFKVTPTAEDANNSLLTAFATEQLQQYYEADGVQTVYLIDPVVVRRSFDVTKVETIKAQLSQSATAVETRSQVRVPNFKDYNYTTNLGSTDTTLPVSVTMAAGETVTDLQGLPIHADAIVDVNVERRNGTNRGPVMNSPTDSRLLCRTGVMVDLVPVDPELLEENRTKRRGSFEPEVAWAPRGIITNIDQFLTRTPAGTWFSIASVLELARERTWAGTFRGVKAAKDSMNLRDLGMLNIEANVTGEDVRFADPIDTKDPAFDDRAMGIFLDNTVTRSMMLALDCTTTGNQAYMTTNFYNMARGKGDAKKRARSELVKSLRDATDYLIDDFIDLEKCDLIEDSGDLVHMGVWYDNENRARDLRELDNYLAIASRMGKKNADVIGEWVRTWFDYNAPEDRRMADRLEILQAAASGSVTVTGSALRLTLSDEVLDAFVRALDEGKLPLVSRVSGNGDVFMNHRAVSKVAGRSLYRGAGFSRENRERDGRGRKSYAADRY